MKAVLFDYDGVIVDSMHHHAEAWQRLFAGMGIPVRKEDIFLQEGRPTTDVVRMILRQHGQKVDDETCRAIAKQKENMYIVGNAATIHQPALSLVAELRRRHIKVGLVTGSPFRSIAAVLPEEVLQQFDVVISADDVQQGKPAPDPYLQATRRLGVPADACLVVENAPLGIQAARAAGMRVVAITTTLPASVLQGADAIVHDFEELKEIVVRTISSQTAASFTP